MLAITMMPTLNEWINKKVNEVNHQETCHKVRSNKRLTYHKAMIVHVQDEVLAHYSQPDECNISSVEEDRKHFNTRAQYHYIHTLVPEEWGWGGRASER